MIRSPYDISEEISDIVINAYDMEGFIKNNEMRQQIEWLLDEWKTEVEKHHYDP